MKTNNQKGFIQLLIPFILLFVVATGIGYYAFKNGQIKLPTQNISLNSPTSTIAPTGFDNWIKYNAVEDGFLERNNSNFTFEYPPDFLLDHASGPGNEFSRGTDVLLTGPGFVEITVTIVNYSGSPQEQAKAYFKHVIDDSNCKAFPDICNKSNYTVFDTNLNNDQRTNTSVVSGPTTDGEVYDLYFVQSNNLSLGLMFVYKNREGQIKMRDKILSTFQFTK